MDSIRVTGVPEHFNYPIIRAIQKPLPITTHWHYTPEGTGAMIEQLKNGETDVALLLTEGFVKANQMLSSALYFGGFYISTPLVWGVHAGAEWNASQYPKNPPKKVLISRKNSGSHLMFGLLQDRYEWNFEPKFEIINNLQGAIVEAQKESNFLFLWEKYTTQPYCEQGTFQRLDDLPSPWPAFSIAVHQRVVDHFGRIATQQWLQATIKEIKNTIAQPTLIADIASYSKLPEARVASWRNQTRWVDIPASDHLETLERAQDRMRQLGIVSNQAQFNIL